MMELKITKTKKLFVVFSMMIFISASSEMELDQSGVMQKVERNLLSMLGMKSRPVVDRRKAYIPQAMLDLYEKQLSHEYQSTALPLPGALTRLANTARSYTHHESSVDERFVHSHRFRLHFKLSDFPENEVVTASELRLSIVPKESDEVQLGHQRVNVYDIVKPGMRGRSKPILRLVDTQFVNSTANATSLGLNVLPIVERWLSDEASNHGLLIDVRLDSGEKVAKSHVRLKRSVDEENDSWEAVQPLLLLYSQDPKVNLAMSRSKRNLPTQTKSRKRTRDECRRHMLWVDFEKVGWNDWIVAPPGYDAYYCAGDCPTQFADHLNTTNHAIVQSLVHSVHPQTIPKPCCVPTSLSSISMLYLDEHNKAVLKNYPDMVVEGCGCR